MKMENDNNEKFTTLLRRIEELKTNPAIDLSADEDLALSVMNLVSLEEHFIFTGNKLNQDEFFDLAGEIREVRKSHMAKLLPRAPGETWCAVKHLLAASMRSLEVGQKLKRDGQADEAKEMFRDAYRLYALVWALKLKIADVRAIKNIDQPMSVEDLLGQLADCCDE